MTRTLWWEDNQLKMIDQRVLPLTFTVLSYGRYEDVAQAITDMVVRGAPAIGATGGFGMALAASQSPARDRDSLLIDLAQAKAVLDAARPTAVNLSWATSRLLDLAHHLVLSNPSTLLRAGVDDIRSSIVIEAQRIADEDVEINRRMGAFGAAIVPQPANILTHCNAGSLATVDYGTTLGVVRAAVEAGKQVHVWVDETRPRLQGARLTVWELMRDAIPMTLIADNAAGMLMRAGKVDLVLFGADRVAANGDVANKIGTYMVAVLARRHGIPFYVACPLSTIDLNIATGAGVPIEERAADEVKGFRDCHWAAEGVQVRNPAFDVTPAELVTGLITERGVLKQPDARGVRQLMG